MSNFTYLEKVRKSKDSLNIKSIFKSKHPYPNNFNELKSKVCSAGLLEGVEDRNQKEFLAEHECDIFQGFFFSKPILKEDFVAYLK